MRDSVSSSVCRSSGAVQVYRKWSFSLLTLWVVSVVGVGGCALPPDPSATDGSVSDVMGSGGDPTAGQQTPDVGMAKARVRNESTSRQADVTVRFIRGEVVEHLAFVRVLPETATTVVNSQQVDTVEIYGVDDAGNALARGEFVYGQDFTDAAPVEYVIYDDRVEIVTPTPGDGPAPTPTPIAPSTLALLEPANDMFVPIGSTVTARWTDYTERPDTVVRLFLRPINATADSALVSVSPAIAAALDGINDTMQVALGNLAPGKYEVVAELDDGTSVITSTAPGQITIYEPMGSEDRPPELAILAPHSGDEIALSADQSLNVQWQDDDPDDNATIIFSLERSDGANAGQGAVQISPPLAEDPDGPLSDQATFPVGQALPGVYDLVGTISDGQLSAVVRVDRAVLVKPSEQPNQAPTIALASLGNADIDVPLGGTLNVNWTDDDPDNNAQIMFFLDPDLDATTRDNNEIVLADSISEDDETDQLDLVVPQDTPVGEYRLGALIFDGQSEMEDRSSVTIIVVDPGDGRGDNTNPDDNGGPGDSGNGDNNGGDPTGPGDPPITTVRPGLVTVAPLPDRQLSLLIPIDSEPVIDRPRLVTISNIPFGGSTTVTFTPATWSVEAGVGLTVPMPQDLIPNRAWPREFEVTVTGADAVSIVPPSVVWLPQEVELLSAGAVNYSCDSSGELLLESGRFHGIEVDFFGGGLTESDPGATVQLWLTSDGAVPAGGVEDAGHRVIWESPGSPNVTTTIEVDIESVRSGTALSDGTPELLLGLEPGKYSLVAVTDFQSFGRQVSPIYPRQIEVCAPAGTVQSTGLPLAP